MCMTHSESTEIQDILIKTNLSELALTAYKVPINQQLPDSCLIFLHCTYVRQLNVLWPLYHLYLWVRPVLKVQEKSCFQGSVFYSQPPLKNLLLIAVSSRTPCSKSMYETLCLQIA
jgi:hypothetical protein